MEKLIFCNLDLLKNKPDENDYEEYARPPRQSFIDGPSTVFCVAVVE